MRDGRASWSRYFGVLAIGHAGGGLANMLAKLL